MEEALYNAHLEVGVACGQEKTCGKKTRFATEEKALRAASHHNKWEKRHHDVEHYPCVFCGEWHIGRFMDIQITDTD